MYSGLYLFQVDSRGNILPVGPIEGFDESSRFFEEDVNGTIWVGQYYKGLYRLDLSDDLSEASVDKVTSTNGIPVDDQIRRCF